MDTAKKASPTGQYYMRLSKVTGMILFAHRSTQAYTGTKAELNVIYKKVLVHNLLFGWWGIFSFVWTIMALVKNSSSKQKLDNL